MRTRKIPVMLYSARFLLMSLVLAGSFIFPASHLVYAHTFSTSESAEFLSLADQIRVETGLVTMNLENNNNATLAQAHAEKASSLLDNNTLGELRERNNRIADSLETGLEQLKGNVTSLISASQGQISQDRIQSVSQTVTSLNDTLAEAVTVRVENEQQNNATTWALALADLVNAVLSDYGNATGASFDLTDMSNMAGMGGMQLNDINNMTIMTSDEHVQMPSNNSEANAMTMGTNASSSMDNMTVTIVDTAGYQSAQYLANNTILRLFNDTLKPLTMRSNETSPDSNNATTTTQEGQDNSPTPDGNVTSNIDKLEAGLLQLKDNINDKATPNEVMMTANLNIHPILMQIYGLTLEQEHEEQDADHSEVP
jgi:hypothetical protein